MTGTEGDGWLARFAGDAAVAGRLGEARQIADMLRVEAAYARALGRVGLAAPDIAEAAAAAIEAARIDRAQLAKDAAVDGMPVPGLVRQLQAQLDAPLHAALHKGLTSQDVMDSALMLALGDILDDFEDRIGAVEAALAELSEAFGGNPLTGRTRMQAALPVTVAHRIDGWARPITAHRTRLAQLRTGLLRLQLGGPVGTRGSFAGKGEAVAAAMAADLGLQEAPAAWHVTRAPLAELASWLSMVSGSLGKMGHDLCLMAQQGVDAATIRGGGASSAMAHKANPVRAELLVTLARFNAVQVAGMHLALDHEQERSGVSWTLEWLILPPMLAATGAGLRQAAAALADVTHLGNAGG